MFPVFFFFLAALGFTVAHGPSLVVASGGYSLAAVHGLLIAAASPVAEQETQYALTQYLWPMGSSAWA